jgi:type II secretory pathway pseudopilin PulG
VKANFWLMVVIIILLTAVVLGWQGFTARGGEIKSLEIVNNSLTNKIKEQIKVIDSLKQQQPEIIEVKSPTEFSTKQSVVKRSDSDLAAKAMEDGLRIGYRDGYNAGYSANRTANPNYAKVLELTAGQKKTIASSEKTIGSILSAEFRESCINAGIRTGLVFLYFQGSGSLVLVTFATKDLGPVYYDWVGVHNGNSINLALVQMKIEIGRSYAEINGLPKQEYDDIIGEVVLVW